MLVCGGIEGCKLLGIELNGVDFVGHFVRGKKLYGVFVVMGMHLERMWVVFGVVVVGYLV